MKRNLKFAVTIACIAALALLSGFAAKHITYASLHNQTSIFDDFKQTESGWLYSNKIGAASATGLERAKVAIGGPLGLSAKEAVYFIGISDSQGRELSSQCVYRVTGTSFDSRWWSLTLYDRQTQHYVPNSLNRASWNSVDVPRSDANSWSVNVSQTPQDTAWLPSQPEDGKLFELILRLYNPSDDLRAALPDINLPTVERVSC